ncbi:Acetyl-coenzyme A synthetase [Usitatibacter rugosus]|uniref:Acetyl-coenzyme A synthetase n=1 Tax=Usitatibacter rugosus TaxID=2732067 RepID=A0A6M4H1A2_9PROT|nr:AMP-binding protein [Usitatibacter rugosus]QJR13122.1 Acetyl-coenzyme A synthetase [Usitatibacter rugosus]
MTDRYRETYLGFRWQVPPRYNIAQSACRRWSSDPARPALLWEDESGATASLTFAQLLAQANRLSNALAALGVARGDRVAILLPQRLETAVAYFACLQVGAIAVPLSFLFGPEALEYRVSDSEASVAIADPQTMPNLAVLRDRLPALRHVIGVAGARESGTLDWDALLAKASDAFECADTAPTDPAVIIYTSGTTGPPKGALMPHSALLGNLPGFECSHDGFPRDGDRFWSPADWAWTGGLWDALMPTLHHGQCILGYRGRFDPEKALVLMEKYAIRNAFLFPTALKMMMKAFPEPRARFALHLRSMMSGGEAVSPAVLDWARSALGVTVNEIFGQTEMNYIVGNSHALWPVRPGSMGRPYPGHRVAVIDDAGQEVPRGTVGDVAVHRQWLDGVDDPVFFLGYWRNEEATRKKFSGDWCRTGDLASMDEDGYLWYQGRADDMFKSAGYRIGPAEIENCLLRHPAVANCAVVPSPDETRGAVVKAFVLLAPGHAPSDALAESIRAHAKAHLAAFQCPKEVEFIEALPMTTTGKVQRNVLRLREEKK